VKFTVTTQNGTVSVKPKYEWSYKTCDSAWTVEAENEQEALWKLVRACALQWSDLESITNHANNSKMNGVRACLRNAEEQMEYLGISLHYHGVKQTKPGGVFA
jgi:hypothetical protein